MPPKSTFHMQMKEKKIVTLKVDVRKRIWLPGPTCIYALFNKNAQLAVNLKQNRHKWHLHQLTRRMGIYFV